MIQGQRAIILLYTFSCKSNIHVHICIYVPTVRQPFRAYWDTVLSARSLESSERDEMITHMPFICNIRQNTWAVKETGISSLDALLAFPWWPRETNHFFICNWQGALFGKKVDIVCETLLSCCCFCSGGGSDPERREQYESSSGRALSSP